MDIEHINKLKKKFTFLKDINDEDAENLDKYISKKKYNQGTILHSDNVSCGGIPIISKGVLRLFRTSPNGREVTVYRLSEGEMCILASICSIMDLNYDFTVQAETDCEVYVMDPQFYKHLIDQNETFRYFVFGVLSTRLIETMGVLEEIHLKDVTSKLVAYLNEKQINGEVKATHENIAVDIGTSREVVTRELAKLKRQGKIELSYRKIKIIKNL